MKTKKIVIGTILIISTLIVITIVFIKNSTSREYLPYDNPYLPIGFTYKEGTWNSGYTIEEIATGNEFVWVPCVLNQRQVKQGDTVVIYKKYTTGKYNASSLELTYKGKDIVSADNSAVEIEKSVGIYGGFYIARYEAGIEGTTANSLLQNKTITDGSVKPLSKPGKGVWNAISRTDAIIVAKAMIEQEKTGVKSSLISGSAWDTTLQWIVKASDYKETNTNYDIESDGKGWYKEVSKEVIHTTGYYATNNIYDMAGNIWEWTTENARKENGNYLVYRGGGFSNVGLEYPAAYRHGDIDCNCKGIGFRIVIYK